MSAFPKDVKDKLYEQTRVLKRIHQAVCSNDIITKCLCDQPLGPDYEVVHYVEALKLSMSDSGLTTVSLGTYTDDTLSVPYVPFAPIDCESVGVVAYAGQGRVVLEGASWSPNILIKSYTVNVHTVDNGLTPPTYTDSFGNTTDLYQGEVFSYSIDDLIIDITPVITSSVGDIVIITYIELI